MSVSMSFDCTLHAIGLNGVFGQPALAGCHPLAFEFGA